MGRLTNFTDTAGGTVRYTYDNVGNRLPPPIPTATRPRTYFDALNRLVKNHRPGRRRPATRLRCGRATSSAGKTRTAHTTTYLYDANNRRTGIIYPTGAPVTFAYDANGNRTNMTDALGTTTYSYDALNRLISVTDPYGKTVSYGYDKNGNRTSVTYPGNKIVTYAYDSMNRLTSVKDWLSNTTTYSYDLDGNSSAPSTPMVLRPPINTTTRTA